jgi:hypothetical protein
MVRTRKEKRGIRRKEEGERREEGKEEGKDHSHEQSWP